MRVQLDLRIFDETKECQAIQSIVFVEESVKPIPSLGDIITLAVHDRIYHGKVFGREFNYCEVDEENPEAQVLIVIDAREQV